MMVEKEKEEEEEGVMNLNNLPEGCIANILSLTTPRDASKLSLVSSTFRSASESDLVWNRFIPSDYQSILSQSSSSSSSSFSDKKKKHLFLFLSQNTLFIHDGQMSFQVDRENGKKCYMLSARMLSIVWGDTPRYWKWVPHPDSRFPEVAELVSVCWFEIRARINTRLLSPQTFYAAYFVFKPIPARAYGFEYQSVDVSIAIAGGEASERSVFLDAERGRRLRYQIVPRRAGLFNRTRFVPIVEDNSNVDDLQCPKERGDGWLEIELGEFFNKGGEDKEVEMGVYETKGGDWKGGLVVQGIEIRPKLHP